MTRTKQLAPDSGAVAITFALLLVVLVGFVGLAIDVGSAYAKSQQVQNGADAAALAVAQECAEADITCSDGDHADLAGNLADGNIRSGYNLADWPNVEVDSNRVTVTVSAENENFFAALFGFDSFTVTREATAQWDSPVSGPVVMPLTISACSFYDQTNGGEPSLGTTLTIFVPQGGPAGQCDWHKDYPPGGFGWLVPDGACRVDVEVGKPEEGKDGFSPPDCVKSLDIKAGDTFLLPVFTKSWKSEGQQWYELQRFAAMELDGIFVQQANTALPAGFAGCGKPPKHHSDTCLKGRFVEWVELGDDYVGGGGESEVSIVRLIDPEYEDSH